MPRKRKNGPAPFDDEEMFYWDGMVFDVMAAKRLVAHRLHRRVRVNDFSRLLGAVTVDPSRAMSYRGRISAPIIIASLPGLRLPIDGWHRLYRASHMRSATIPAHVLTIEETRAVMRREA